MSFMNSGAECSTSRNPLAQFTKHTSEDRSLQHERFGPSAQAPTSMRSANQQMNQQDRQIMDMFNQETKQGIPGGHPFQFDQMNHELGSIHQRPGPANVDRWASDFASQSSVQPHEAINSSQIHRAPVAGDSQNWNADFSAGLSSGDNLAMRPAAGFSGYQNGGMSYMPRMGFQPMSQQPVVQQQPSSSKIIELNDKNWEEQFRQIEENAVSKDKGKFDTAPQEETATEANTTEAEDLEKERSDFESIWENIRNQVLTTDGDDWNDGDVWDRDFDQFARNRTEFGEYSFENNNRYINDPDPFQIGVQLMESGGNLSEAALAFEAAVQKNPDHAEAWGRLGSCQAQNEKEDPAIRALERCITIEPGNLSALMSLAVSYINESYENAAYSTLEKWISTKYPSIVDQARSQEPSLANEDRYQLHSRVTELFLRAAQLSPTGANIDADVQDGLGVLFYGSEDYEKAIDCFTAAISARPNDPLLWNRLGATLANSNKSEEAIEAYSRALQLRPSFVRARYNLGVSCINIGCYHESAQHLLTALSMDHTPEEELLANQSTNLYATLKRVFSAMDRKDLEAKVGVGMDLESFRSEFEF